MTPRGQACTWRAATALTITLLSSACGRGTPATLIELQRIKSGAFDVVLLSPHDALRHGKDGFVVEFRSNGTLVDVGAVRATASMPMSGAAMFGSIDVQRTEVRGRYTATSQFDMAGTWRMTLSWDGTGGRGSVTFSGTVQ